MVKGDRPDAAAQAALIAGAQRLAERWPSLKPDQAGAYLESLLRRVIIRSGGLVRAFAIRDRLDHNSDLSIQRIAEAEGVVASYATRLLRLSFLAPGIVAAILEGRQPPELTANKLMRDTRLPLEWTAQRRLLGFD